MKKIIALAASRSANRHRQLAVAIGAAAAAALLILASPVRAQGAGTSTLGPDIHGPVTSAAPPATIPSPTPLSPPAAGPSLVAADRGASVLNLTVPGLIRDTDTLVRGVLILLLLASSVTWTVWIAKTVELVRARRRLAADVRLLSSANSLQAISGLASEAGQAIIQALRAEMARSGDLRDPICAEGLKERSTVSLLSVETAQARRMSAGINLLASIGATAPFVGLFGTVWGIMSSFIGIARLQTSNLTAVAPGIAEALLTTAAGLAAAVPAVLIYNGFTRSVSGYRALLADASNAAACVLSLEIEHYRTAEPNGDRTATLNAHHGPLKEVIGAV